MSAGICGKRVGFEEICGSSSPPPLSSAKRSRWSSGSPTPPESGSEDTVSVLFQMFPALEPEFVETVLRNNNYKVEDAIESLGAFSSGNVKVRNESDSAVIGNCDAVPDQSGAACSQIAEEKIDDIKNIKLVSGCGNTNDGSKWVDLFVHEMMNATNLDDARVRAARILEAFEQCISAQTRVSEELEHASLKEHLQSLLHDNQILKRAVAIQHERFLEQEERTKGVQQLKHVLSQYQERLRNLELNNYALKLHLQRAQGSSAMSGHSLPDIF
ncbi:Ubiquitin system component Cue [Quillaja saponaria]|uniref:Ubiquitin system component Cue n=1 Tax=Quillaja saponaria TaxID=32244 RepID=A0AAD7Q8Y3_QUISA|nr:Ubiquitin system component Cue [Quillaja saponaria]